MFPIRLHILHRNSLLHLLTLLLGAPVCTASSNKTLESKWSSLVNRQCARGSKVLALCKFWCHTRNYSDWYSSLACTLSSRANLLLHSFLQEIHCFKYSCIFKHTASSPWTPIANVLDLPSKLTEPSWITYSNEKCTSASPLPGSQTLCCSLEVGTSTLHNFC